MTPDFAKAVDPVFLRVLGLLERIGRGEQPNPEEERNHIRAYLTQAQAKAGETEDWELAKYALVSWIDEVLSEADWDGRHWWNENAMEVEVFATRVCNEQFYVRAKEASRLSRRNALEVYYVCVVLGFRGLYRDPVAASILAEPHGLPRDLEAWARATAMAIQLGQGRRPLNDGGVAAPRAAPLEGPFLLIASALGVVVLAAVDVILAWMVFFP